MTYTTGNTRVHPFRVWTLYVQLVWNHRQALLLTPVVCGLCFQYRGRMQTHCSQQTWWDHLASWETSFSCIAYSASVLNINEDSGTAINKVNTVCRRSLCSWGEESLSVTHTLLVQRPQESAHHQMPSICARLCKVWSTLPTETWQSRDPFST